MKLTKKILSAITASALCLVVSAEIVPEDILQRFTSKAEEYNGFEYTIETNWNDEQYISINDYNGTETDIVVPYEIDGLKVTRLDLSEHDNITSVVISEGFTELYGYELSFKSCQNLESVTLPASMKSYYGYSFSGCSNLTEINVAEGSESLFSDNGILYENYNDNYYDSEIEDYVERTVITCIECPEGKEDDIYIYEGTTNIWWSAFEDCTKITSINVPDSVKGISYYFGRGCSSLTEINVAEGNEKYFSDNGVLYGNYSNYIYNSDTGTYDEETSTAICVYPEGREPASYSILDGTNGIGGLAFENTKITSLNIPDSVTRFVGAGIFNNCEYLEEINYNGKPEYIDTYALYDPYSYPDVVLPPVFANAPDGMVYLGDVLALCTGEVPDDIVIKDGTSKINSYAFSGNENIKTITVPASVEYIGTGAFDCKSLTAINVESGNPVYSSADGVLFKENGTALIQYPESKPDTSYTVPEGVTAIYAQAFEGNKNITEVNMPDSLETIGYMSFAKCESLKNINMPTQMKEIGYYAFDNCTSLEELVIPFGIKSLNSCIYGCSSLKSLDLPESISSFSYSSYYSDSLEKLTIRNPECSLSDLSKLPSGVTVLSYEDSTIQTTAESNGLIFQSLGQYPVFETGDINNDGYIDAVDSSIALVEYAELSTSGNSTMMISQQKSADVNSDGEINAVDATLISTYYTYLSTNGTQTFEEFLVENL